MSGTIEGGHKARDTNIKKHGPNFYAEIGRKGGRASNNGGFTSNKIGQDGLTGRERASVVGIKGGRKSRRGPSKNK